MNQNIVQIEEDQNNLSNIISKIMNEKFTNAWKNQITKKYVQDTRDENYKDTEINIFLDENKKADNEKYRKGITLRKRIKEESELFRDTNLRYEEIKEILVGTDGNNGIKGRIYHECESRDKRTIQVHKNMPGTEEYDINSREQYKADFMNRIDYIVELLDLLMELGEIEKNWWKNGIDISIKDEYEIYLLNKCIILSQIPYCRKECLALLDELNSRVHNSVNYTGEFLYRLSELNFTMQNYTVSRRLLKKTIKKLQREIEASKNTSKKEKDTDYFNNLNDMLFASYQLEVLNYEFCGNYEKAIILLTTQRDIIDNDIKNDSVKIESRINEVVKMIENKLIELGFEQGIDDLIYSTFDDSKRLDMVKSAIEKIFEKQMFSSDIFSYARSEENQRIFKDLVEKENERIRSIIDDIKGADKEKKEQAFNLNAIRTNESNLLLECIHLLAHCINEYGVTLLKDSPMENGNEKSFQVEDQAYERKLVVLGRALMLFVSEKEQAYKSCYATTFAEAGDLDIAIHELQSLESGDDVVTKAENAFFVYLIESIMQIEKGVYVETENMKKAYNRFLNYCYRCFDYDAIAHIKIYELKLELAKFAKTNNISESGFLDFAEQKVNGETRWQKFVKEVYFQNSNDRLLKEYEKIKYIYNFLYCFFKEHDGKSKEYYLDNEPIKRSVELINCASRYMYYHNEIQKGDSDHSRISFPNTSDVQDSIRWIKSTSDGIVEQENGNFIFSPFCALLFIDDGDLDSIIVQREFLSKIENRAVFVVSKDNNKLENVRSQIRRTYGKILPKVRYFTSSEAAIKEFIVFNTFFTIKDDFTNPYNIFVLTPIGTAKSCRYSIGSTVSLLDANSLDKNVTNGDSVSASQSQHQKLIARISDRREWLGEMSDSVCAVIELNYNERTTTGITKYKYTYSTKNSEIEWHEAVLFEEKKIKADLELQYTERLETSNPHMCGRGECRISVIKRNLNKDTDEFFKSFETSFSNISWKKRPETIYLFNDKIDSEMCWRIVVDSAKVESERELIRTKMCVQYMPPPKQSIADEKICPVDYEKTTMPFWFISHATSKENDPEKKIDKLFKEEIESFFKKYKIPIWYDNYLLVSKYDWKPTIARVMESKNCVGIIFLVMGDQFFENKGIAGEVEIAYNVNLKKKSFLNIPIVYQGTGEKMPCNGEEVADKVENAMYKQIKMDGTQVDRDEKTKYANYFVPKTGRPILVIKPSEGGLAKYTEMELKESGASSFLKACDELGVPYEIPKD